MVGVGEAVQETTLPAVVVEEGEEGETSSLDEV